MRSTSRHPDMYFDLDIDQRILIILIVRARPDQLAWNMSKCRFETL